MGGTDGVGEPAHRGATGGVARWLLLTGNRLAVSAVLLVGFAGPFVAVGLVGLATVTAPTRVLWFLNGTVNGLLTLVPIAVGVNQIVLSHEFGSIGDLYDRRTDVSEFRRRVESRTGVGTTSPRASAFFEALLAAVSETAASFERECERTGSRDGEVERFARSVVAEADRTADRLAGDGQRMLDTLLLLLDYDDSVQFYETRRLSDRRDLGDGATAKLHELEELFAEIDAARQFLKTVVVERQLARLSRLLIYTGVPAVAVAAVGIFTYRDIAGVTLPRPALVAVAGGLIAASLVPLAVLSAYILRVATIARRTAAFGPFVPEESVSDDWP